MYIGKSERVEIHITAQLLILRGYMTGRNTEKMGNKIFDTLATTIKGFEMKNKIQNL